jgi:iron complex transport system substrate-binding protein
MVVASLACGVAAPNAVEAQAITVRDVAGRTVSIPGPASRIVIDDARYLVALSLIQPDPVSLLAAWPRDINRLGEQVYERFRERFPQIASVGQTSSSAGTFSIELTLAARPDLAIFTLGMGPSEQQLQQLERAGVPVVFLDFFSQPFENLETSLAILGRVTGREAQATAFIEFRRERMSAITERLRAASPSTPDVFLEAHAGISEDCCNSPGRGNIGDYISFVGGHNIGADVLPGPTGRLNLEYVISRDPAVYVATGGPHLERPGGLVIGPGYTAERARAALGKMASRRGISELGAVGRGRVHGLSHQLLNSPLDILAVEVLAKWVHPELFGDLDPEATMVEINRRFLAVPLEGAHWVDLR